MRTDISQGFVYTSLTDPNTALYQLAVFILPDGSKKYLSDREFQVQPGLTSEALIESWGELSYSSGTAETAGGNGVPIKNCTLSILNVGPDWFTSYFNDFGGITGVGVEIWQYAGNNKALIDTFVVQDNIRHSQSSLTVSVDLVSKVMANDPYIGTVDPMTNMYYSMSLGAVSGVPGSLYGIHPYAKLDADIARFATTILTDRDLADVGFTAPGEIEIGINTVSYTGISGNSFVGCTGVELSAAPGQFITKKGHDYVFAFGAGPVDMAGPVYVDGQQYTGEHTIDVNSNPVTVTFPGRLPNLLDTKSPQLVAGDLIQSSPDGVFWFGQGTFSSTPPIVNGTAYGYPYEKVGGIANIVIIFPGGLPYSRKYISPGYYEYTYYDECSAWLTRPSERTSYINPTLNIGDPAAGGVNPADAILGVLSKNPSLPADEDSFSAARAWYDANDYEFTGLIPGDQRMRKTLLDMCRQSRSILYSSGGKIFLKVKGIDNSAPVQVYRSESKQLILSVAENSIAVEDQRADDIVNSINVRYDAADIQAGYQGSFNIKDDASISRYRNQENTFDMYLVSALPMATDVAQYELSVSGYPYTIVTFRGFTEAFPLEIDDLVAIVTRYNKMIYFEGHIVNVKRIFGSLLRNQPDHHEITIAGYYRDVMQLEVSDSQPMVEDVEVKNLDGTGYGDIPWGDDAWG